MDITKRLTSVNDACRNYLSLTDQINKERQRLLDLEGMKGATIRGISNNVTFKLEDVTFLTGVYNDTEGPKIVL